MGGLLPVPGDRVGCAVPCVPGRLWSGPGPVCVRGKDWLAARAEVAQSLDGVGGVSALDPLGGGLGLPSCDVVRIEFDEHDISIGYPSSVNDLDSVGEHENPSTHIVLSWWGPVQIIRNG